MGEWEHGLNRYQIGGLVKMITYANVGECWYETRNRGWVESAYGRENIIDNCNQ